MDTNARMLFNLGLKAEKQGRTDLATEYYRSVSLRFPNDPEIRAAWQRIANPGRFRVPEPTERLTVNEPFYSQWGKTTHVEVDPKAAFKSFFKWFGILFGIPFALFLIFLIINNA